ncbi:MAG: hypothetical protein JOZ47_15795 [Kutzneria sp.]|nr:hypothetical protein [Kutzneria sp.]
MDGDAPEPLRALQDLQEAEAAQRSAVTHAVHSRSRWILAGGLVVGVSVLGWLAGPGPVNIAFLLLIAACVAASLVGRSPRWAGLTGKRVRLRGQLAGDLRWFVVATLLGVVALSLSSTALS